MHTPPAPHPPATDEAREGARANVGTATPRVGVVIRTRDRPLFVTRALRSVAAQSYPGWRIALVNDGGDAEALDGAIDTAGLAAQRAGGALTVLHMPASVGRSAAFNAGARALSTEMVCCLDDDDTWDPAFLDALLAHYDRTVALAPDLGGVASLVTAVREDIVVDKGRETLVELGHDELPHAFRRHDFFLNPVTYAAYRHDLYPVQWMLNREAVLAAGGFPERFDVMEDRAFLTAFLQRWRLAILDKPLAFHHRREKRRDDLAKTAALNTLDNPSYDWRLYADLAKSALNSPRDDAPTAGLLRATASTILRELNDETSALWHKVNGEAALLKGRLDALEAKLGVTGSPVATAPAEARLWSLWDVVGGQDAGYPVGAATPFLERLELSVAETLPGMLMHAGHATRRLVVQLPLTQDWAALELALKGLESGGKGLRCEMILSHPEGYLFESALSLPHRDGRGRRVHAFEGSHVHACPQGAAFRLVRDFPDAWLARSETPKLSIVLPRHAANFRFVCHDIVVSRL